MGLATSELVQSCSDCALSSRYGGICFCRPRWRRSGLGIGGDDRATAAMAGIFGCQLTKGNGSVW